MAAAYVQKAINGSAAASTTIAVSTGSDVTAGNGIAVFFRDSTPGASLSCADGLGNTYTQIHIASSAANGSLAVFVAKDINGGACTVTGTSSATTRKCIGVREFSGLDLTAPEDQFADAIGTDDTVEGPAITMTRGGALMSAVNTAQTITFDTDYTEGQQNSTGRAGDCHQITVAVTEGADHTLSSAADWETITWDLIEPAAGGAGGNVGRLLFADERNYKAMID